MRLDPFPTGLAGPARAISRLALRTQRTRLRPLWAALHMVAARIAVRYLERGLRGSSAHLAGSLARDEAVYGLSDIDLVFVIDGSTREVEAADRLIKKRWARLSRAIPGLDRLGSVAVYGARFLEQNPEDTCLTHGLAGGESEPELDGGFLHPRSPRNELYRLIHPGLSPLGASWRRLTGSYRRLSSEPPSRDYLRLAGWLELQWWWRYSFLLCAHPELHSAPYLSFKLVAEPARIWVRLAGGEPLDRQAAIATALEVLGEDQPALAAALEQSRDPGRVPAPPLADVLDWMLRCGRLIAELIEEEIAGEPADEVLLVGVPSPGDDGGPAELPLADWRARVFPERLDERLVPVRSDPADPGALAAATAAAVDGVQPALMAPGLLVEPADAMGRQVLLRAVQFRASDPVSFALLEGNDVASFPRVPGWSAVDCARRAVAEHRNGLAGAGRHGERPSKALRLNAARAALFLDSVERGEPRLPLTSAATVELLAERLPPSEDRLGVPLGELVA